MQNLKQSFNMGNATTESNPFVQHPRIQNCQRQNGSLVYSPAAGAFLSDWVRKVRHFQKQIHPDHRLLLPKIEETVAGRFCGADVSYKLLYPDFEFNLRKEIMDRQPTSQKFTEPQLWYLLYQLLFSSFQFQKHKLKSGDIRPINVLLNADGQLLLVNVYSFPEETTNFFKSLQHHEPTYLSPEQLWDLEQKVAYPKCDQATAESFSIGMTLMDAALLTNSQELYDCKKVTFSINKFNENMVSFKTSHYSPFFVKTVLNLVEGKSVERISPGEAWAIIRPYRDQIVNLEEFVPDREESKKSLQAFQATL